MYVVILVAIPRRNVYTKNPLKNTSMVLIIKVAKNTYLPSFLLSFLYSS